MTWLLLLAKSSPGHLLLLGLEVEVGYEHNDTTQIIMEALGCLGGRHRHQRRHGARTATVASGKIISSKYHRHAYSYVVSYGTKDREMSPTLHTRPVQRNSADFRILFPLCCLCIQMKPTQNATIHTPKCCCWQTQNERTRNRSTSCIHSSSHISLQHCRSIHHIVILFPLARANPSHPLRCYVVHDRP